MAAKVLKQSYPGYIEGKGVGADALDKTVDALRMRYNKTPLQGGQFFKTEQAVGGVWKVSTYGTTYSLPVENQDSDDIPFVSPVKGFPQSFTAKNYRLGTQIERTFQEDQLQDVAMKMAGGLMNSGRLLHEYAFVDVFNNATTSSGYDGADGVPFADNSHPHPRRQGGTWDNLETAASLTHGNYSTARVNMRNRTDQSGFGYPMPVKPKKLVTVAENEQKAKEIFNSEKVDDNALNTTNVWRGEVEIFIYDYLTSTTAWMLEGDIPQEHSGLHYVVAAPMQISPTVGKDKSTDIISGTRLRVRFIVGFSTSHNWSYNAGA